MHNYTTQTAPVARIFQIRTRSIDHIAYPADIKLFYSSEPRFINTTKSQLIKAHKSCWHQNLQLRFSPAVKMTHIFK